MRNTAVNAVQSCQKTVNKHSLDNQVLEMTENQNIQQFQHDIEDLQTRLAYQEDTLQQLDQTIADQDKIIRSLVVQLSRWEARINEISDSVAHTEQPASELPPHY